MFFEHVSVLNSQSVLRNDVTSYALAQWVWDLFRVEFVFFFIVLAPEVSWRGKKMQNLRIGSKGDSNPDSLDRESGILPRSTFNLNPNRNPNHVTTAAL